MSEKFTSVGELEREIVAELFAMRDEKYRDFHARLIPNVPREKIIGVRTPRLRSYAKELFRSGRAEQFMQMELPAATRKSFFAAAGQSSSCRWSCHIFTTKR